MKALKGMLLAAAAALALAGLGACNNNVNSVENAEKAGTPAAIDAKRVITDAMLEHRLSLQPPVTSINESGLLQVQVSGRNTRTGFWAWLIHGDMPYRLVYKFVWLDSKGMEVQNAGTSTFIERQVLPGDTIRFSGIAPSPDCKDFQLYIKEMDNP